MIQRDSATTVPWIPLPSGYNLGHKLPWGGGGGHTLERRSSSPKIGLILGRMQEAPQFNPQNYIYWYFNIDPTEGSKYV